MKVKSEKHSLVIVDGDWKLSLKHVTKYKTGDTLAVHIGETNGMSGCNFIADYQPVKEWFSNHSD